VPYKATAQSLTDVIAGHLHVAIPSLTTSLAHVRAGKLRALGITSTKRSTQLPEVPAIAEVLPGYQAVIWNAALAPVGTPAVILERLSKEIAAAMRAPEAVDRYRALGAETIGSSPEEFRKFLRDEIEINTRVIKAGGLKAELIR